VDMAGHGDGIFFMGIIRFMAADNLPNTDISHFAKETVKIEGIVLFAVRYVFAEWRATGKTVYRHKKQRKMLSVALVVAIVIVVSVQLAKPKEMQVHFIDVCR